MSSRDSFGARSSLSLHRRKLEFFRLTAAAGSGDVSRLPYALRVMLENLLRCEDGDVVTPDQIEAVLNWDPAAEPEVEIAFAPGRILAPDSSGVPLLVDLASMRTTLAERGDDPSRIAPRLSVDIVVDHSIQVDTYGSATAMSRNVELDLERNRERYAFLDWARRAFDGVAVVPSNTGICHQVNLERLARVVDVRGRQAFPDTVLGTDSHTPMVNGLGVLGWGVGGLEATAALLGESIRLLLPRVVGVHLVGRLPVGAGATDLVLTLTEVLRGVGVVGAFVEYFGPGLEGLTVADRATVANMAPEYGATCGFFPVDEESLRYLRLTGREEAHVELVESYCRENSLWHSPGDACVYSRVVEVDLEKVEASVAGPRRPQDRIALRDVKGTFRTMRSGGVRRYVGDVPDGAVAIAAITSCTNTSNPVSMVTAGLVARNAVRRGLRPRAWVKTSLAPGSRAVTAYLDRAGLVPYLDDLGFQTVAYGCATCVGNSGPLHDEVVRALREPDLTVCAVLSGNRNFEARVHPDVRDSYLASPALVVAYALAGSIDVDLTMEPLGTSAGGEDVYLSDLWPEATEIDATVADAISPQLYRDVYRDAADIPVEPVDAEVLHRWDESSTYLRRAPFAELDRAAVAPLEQMRCLAWLGDSVTTDHISPGGRIAPSSVAGAYLATAGEPATALSSYIARRGNHEVMIRGTFAHPQLRNHLVEPEGGPVTLHVPSGDRVSIFAAAKQYAEEATPLLVLAGRDYGNGSSRDWAAKGPRLLGVRVVIAESFERIHRTNLVLMGILPLQFLPGESAATLGLTGRELFSVEGFAPLAQSVTVVADELLFGVTVRLETAREYAYLAAGGILPFLLDATVERCDLDEFTPIS